MLRVRTTLSGWVGGPGLMTHYFECDTEDIAAVVRCRAHVRDLFTNAYHALMCSNTTWLVQTAVDELTTSDGHVTNTFNDATVLTAAGTGGASQSPPATAGLWRLNTSTWHSGRRLQGRTFLSPLAAGALEVDGTWPNATVATVNTAAAAVISGLPATDKFVVWHRPVSGAGGLTGACTSMVLQDKLAVLTSRRD